MMVKVAELWEERELVIGNNYFKEEIDKYARLECTNARIKSFVWSLFGGC